jgi:cell division protease FtsH
MSEKLGPVRYAGDQSMYLQTGNWGNRTDLSAETVDCIDDEIRERVKEAQHRSMTILRENRALLDTLAQVLIEKETLTGDEMRDIIEESLGKEPSGEGQGTAEG